MQMRSPIAALWTHLTDRRRVSDGLMHGILSAVAAVAAYLPTQVLGLREGFWAAITALVVIQSELEKARSSAVDQLSGATIGGVIGVTTATFAEENFMSYGLAVIFSMMACSILNLASASRLSGITATIILLVPYEGSAEKMMVSRITEVGWGVCVALAVVWLQQRRSGRITQRSDTAGHSKALPVDDQ